MASYFDEHASTDKTAHPNFLLELARLLLSSDDLIQLTSAGFNDIGSPPASKAAVQELPSIEITGLHLKDESSSSCPICLAEYETGEKAKQMPCDHLFHGGCILPWLEKTNSCPVCRHELPTDNEEYEELKKLKDRLQVKLKLDPIKDLSTSRYVAEKDRQHRVETLHSSMFS